MTTKSNPEGETKHAYLYSRVSRNSQISGTGLSRQGAGKAICDRYGWTLETDTFSDPGLSAFKGDNLNPLKGDLARFIFLAKSKKLKSPAILIFECWDRFSRQDLDSSFDEARKLLKTGVDICVGFGEGKVFTAVDLNDITKRIDMELSMKQAWEYSHNLSVRVNAAFKIKYQLASEGKAVELGAWQPSWIDFVGPKKGIGSFIKNEIAPVIKNIAIDYINNKSMLQIANDLNDKKVPCIRKGVEWTQGQIATILHSESLIGTVDINNHRFEKYYPAILTDNEYNLLKSKLEVNKNKKGGIRKGEWIANLFPNRIKCSCCGGSISTSIGRNNRYYKCSTSRRNKNKCSVKSMVPIINLEQDFFLLFLNQHPSELLGKDMSEIQTKISTLNAEIADIDKLVAEAVELLGKIPAKALEAKLTTLNNSRNDLVTKRDNETKHLMVSSNAPESILDVKKAILGEDEIEMDKAIEQVTVSLQNPEVRAKLVQLLPSIIDHLTVDLVNKQYTITTLDGKTTEKEYIGN